MKRFRNIVFFADGEYEQSSALRRAVRLAETNNARLTVIDVLESVTTPSEVFGRFNVKLDEVLSDYCQDQLDRLVSEFMPDDSLIYTEVLTGTPYIEVIRAIKNRGYDLLIKAAKAPLRASSQQIFGSTDLHLLRKCPCPVWIDRPSDEPTYRNVLAAVDPADDSGENCDDLIMELAVSLSETEGAQVNFVHAWRLEGESMLRKGLVRMQEEEVDDLLRNAESRHRDRLSELMGRYGIDIDDTRVKLIKDEPAAAIYDVAAAVAADLIILGTVGRVGIPGYFIGNTAEEVIDTTCASVLALKPEGFVSPVE
jgi:nucleotide-binding universal stress UspA family protein